MADLPNHETFENLKKEFSTMKEQLENFLKSAAKKESEASNDILDRLGRELEHLRKNAGYHAHNLYETGARGAEDVSEHVRRNPLASVLIAFGAGYMLSCLFRHLR